MSKEDFLMLAIKRSHSIHGSDVNSGLCDFRAPPLKLTNKTEFEILPPLERLTLDVPTF